MNDKPPGEPGTERAPFSSWLDSIIPAVFKNDAEFARKLGVNQSYVHRWRRGVRPQVPALMKMAKLTGTDIGTLLMIAGYDEES
jgi:transcriptional regulator with XRE-family HTH domain